MERSRTARRRKEHRSRGARETAASRACRVLKPRDYRGVYLREVRGVGSSRSLDRFTRAIIRSSSDEAKERKKKRKREKRETCMEKLVISVKPRSDRRPFSQARPESSPVSSFFLFIFLSSFPSCFFRAFFRLSPIVSRIARDRAFLPSARRHGFCRFHFRLYDPASNRETLATERARSFLGRSFLLVHDAPSSPASSSSLSTTPPSSSSLPAAAGSEPRLRSLSSGCSCIPGCIYSLHSPRPPPLPRAGTPVTPS